MTLGDRLKKFRGKRIQEDIADRLGVSRASYSHYENDHVQPDIETLLKMANLFGTTTDYLLGGILPNETKENAHALHKSKMDEAIKRIENELGISIADDPVIIEGLENYLLTMGKMKKQSE